MNNILQPLAHYLRDCLRERLQKDNHNASKELSNSIKVVVRNTMQGFVIEGSSLYYGVYLEHGRKPGAKGIPLDALLEWIHVRNITIEGMKDKSIAFMFQQSIKRKGIAAVNWIQDTLDDCETRINEDITKAMGAYVDIIIETIFVQFKQ